jgi:hypothetical protein
MMESAPLLKNHRSVQEPALRGRPFRCKENFGRKVVHRWTFVRVKVYIELAITLTDQFRRSA